MKIASSMQGHTIQQGTRRHFLIFMWLEFCGIQAKVEIVEYMSCILGLLNWSIGLANNQIHGQGYFDNCIEALLGLRKQKLYIDIVGNPRLYERVRKDLSYVDVGVFRTTWGIDGGKCFFP